MDAQTLPLDREAEHMLTLNVGALTDEFLRGVAAAGRTPALKDIATAELARRAATRRALVERENELRRDYPFLDD